MSLLQTAVRTTRRFLGQHEYNLNVYKLKLENVVAARVPVLVGRTFSESGVESTIYCPGVSYLVSVGLNMKPANEIIGFSVDRKYSGLLVVPEANFMARHNQLEDLVRTNGILVPGVWMGIGPEEDWLSRTRELPSDYQTAAAKKLPHNLYKRLFREFIND